MTLMSTDNCKHGHPLILVCSMCEQEAMNNIHKVGGTKESALATFDAMMQAGKVNSERGNVYGHPTDNFALIQRLKDCVRDCPDPIAREALEAICVKMARLVATWYHVDSWGDIAGYARCAVMHIERKAKESDKPV